MTEHAPSESQIFRAALKLGPQQRPEYLNAACGGDRHLQAEVESLLRAHVPDDDFLKSPALAITTDRPHSHQVGTIIGPYKLREKIGEGGFGVVYVAEQEKPVRRRVALKIIKPGMDTKDVIARFEAERQTLALMDHPNVARVLDAGTTEHGRPYFVMELVNGVTITDFCDRNKLPTPDRLRLFADVCRAVQHAHQKGIIHRDLKPSNILVTLHDGKPVAKVIDFGVSKALSQQLTEKSIYTAYGQMIGTPSYMSPEQAEMSGLGIDTRSDIYSLGVLLYELLTGKTPLDAARLRASAYAEILRIIKEEEPPLPSLKVSTLGEEATVIAGHRHTDPKQLRRALNGELDWIVMKCLEKDRERRYETANGLARDIERYLADEPVEACPPSSWYRLTKFSRKYRSIINTAVAFAGLLIACAAVSGWLAFRATIAERKAYAAQAQSEKARQEAVAAKDQVEWASKRLSTATRLANEGVEFHYRENRASALAKFAEAAEVEPDLNTTYIYRRMLYTDIGLWDLAAADYAKIFHLSARNNWQSCAEHALLQHWAGDEAGYQAACQEFFRQYSRSNASDVRMRMLQVCCLSTNPAMQPGALIDRAESLLESSDKVWHRSAAAMGFLRAGKHQAVVRICDQILTPNSSSPGDVHRTNYALQAIALHALGRKDEARRALAELDVTVDKWIKQMADGPVGTMPINWFDWLLAQHLHREAKALIDGTPPSEDSRLIALRQRALEITQGDVHTFMDAGRKAVQRQAWDEAADSFATAIDKLPLAMRPSPQQELFYLEMIEQPKVFQRLIELRPDQFCLWWDRGQIFANQGEWSQAAQDFTRALAILEGKEYQRPGAYIVHSLAPLRLLGGDEKGYRELCDSILRNAAGIDDPHAAHGLSRACTLRASSVADASVSLGLSQQAVAASPKIAWYVYGLGAAHFRAGQYEQAIARCEESMKTQPRWLGRGQNFVILAMACQRLGRPQEAQEWLAKARPTLGELEEFIARSRPKYRFAGSPYISDWLDLKVLLAEAEELIRSN
jgi:serine/threonine protein kinase/tetratricopeptide (TPR) repeat protein